MLEKIFSAANQNSPGWEGIIASLHHRRTFTSAPQDWQPTSPLRQAASSLPLSQAAMPLVWWRHPLLPSSSQLSPLTGSSPHLLKCCHKQEKETQGPSLGVRRGRKSGRCLLLQVGKKLWFSASLIIYAAGKQIASPSCGNPRFQKNSLCQAGMETQNLKGFHDSIIWKENKWKGS